MTVGELKAMLNDDSIDDDWEARDRHGAIFSVKIVLFQESDEYVDKYVEIDSVG